MSCFEGMALGLRQWKATENKPKAFFYLAILRRGRHWAVSMAFGTGGQGKIRV